MRILVISLVKQYIYIHICTLYDGYIELPVVLSTQAMLVNQWANAQCIKVWWRNVRFIAFSYRL